MTQRFALLYVLFLAPMLMAAIMVPPETCSAKVSDPGGGPVYECLGTCNQVVGEDPVVCNWFEDQTGDGLLRYCTCGDTQLWPIGQACIHERFTPTGGTESSICQKDDCPGVNVGEPEFCNIIPGPYGTTPSVPCKCPYIKEDNVPPIECAEQGGIWFNGACWWPE